MSYSHSFEARITLAALAGCAALLFADVAAAQSRVGQQWLTSGLSVGQTLVVDDTAPEVGADKVSVGGGLKLRLGFQHAVARPLVMAAEVEAGHSYQRPSRMSLDGDAPASSQFAWQAGLIGRWVPRGNLEGPSLGFGLHTYRMSLPDAAVQSLAADLRFGWYLWQGDHFVLAEIGYALPLLEGVNAPATFTQDAPEIADKMWTMHRFTFGFSYGF